MQLPALRLLIAALCLFSAFAWGLAHALSSDAGMTRSKLGEQHTTTIPTNAHAREVVGHVYAESAGRPEPPAAWKVVAIGLGLVAFQLRRTQRLLHHRELAR